MWFYRYTQASSQHSPPHTYTLLTPTHPHTHTPTHPHTHTPTPAAASIGRQESNRVVPEEETLRRNAPHLCGGNQEEVTSGNQEVKVQFVLSCVQVDDIRRAIRDLEGKIRPLNAEPQV